MKLNEANLDSDILEILKTQEITKFYPPQAEAIPYTLDGKNIVLSIPTAAGKSLIAYLAIIHRLKKERGKALYVVPLRALAREKYEDLKEFEKLKTSIVKKKKANKPCIIISEKSTCCYLSGSKEVVEAFENELKILN